MGFINNTIVNMKCQLKYLPNRVSILEKCCDVVCEAKNGMSSSGLN